MMLTVTTSAASKARIMQCWFSCCSRGDGKARKQCYQHLTTDRENKALGSHLAHASKHLMSKLQLPLPVNFHNVNAFITSCASERSPGCHSAQLLNAAHLPNTINQIQPFCGKKKKKKAVQIINLCKWTFCGLQPFNKNMSLSFINVEFINAGVTARPLKG